MKDCVFVTGGAGFIGSATVRFLLANTDWSVVNIDKLTYAGHLETCREFESHPRYTFHRVDIAARGEIENLFRQYRPHAVMHLAAESHVDRSIDGPAEFIRTNVVGTYELLEAALGYFRGLDADARDRFRFHHVSTDEVFGSLGDEGAFTELTPYSPNSPYSASKAASDHLVRAWQHTYSLPALISNCSNNYGPYQYPEKLIPVVISKCLAWEPIPVYGAGSNVRDWLYVGDHARALFAILTRGRIGETYNVGGNAEANNLDLVNKVCAIVDRLRPREGGAAHASLIEFVTDRPGHDHRYAIDATKIRNELGWKPEQSLDSGLETTVRWYLDNQDWVRAVGAETHTGERLGLQRREQGQ